MEKEDILTTFISFTINSGDFIILTISFIHFIRFINLGLLLLIFIGLFTLSIHFLSSQSNFRLRSFCYLTIFIDSFLITLIITEILFSNTAILIYDKKNLYPPLFGQTALYEPVYSFFFTFVTTISIILHTVTYFDAKKSNNVLPYYFRLDKNMRFFLSSLIFFDFYFLFNYFLEGLIEPIFNSDFEHILIILIDYIFIIIAILDAFYFIFCSLHQPYLFMYLGSKRNLVEKGYVGYFLASMEKEGPTALAISNEFKKMHDLDDNTIMDLALFTLSSIGMFQDSIFQGNAIIPVPTRKEDLRALTFSIFLKNKVMNFDHRYDKQGTPVIFALLLSADLGKSLTRMDNIYDFFINYLKTNEIFDIDQLTERELLTVTHQMVSKF